MFTHLHVHTEYSLLDGMSRISHLVARAKEMGMDSLAITDHGVMYGVIEFYRAATDAGIKPIIGCEVYVTPGNRTSRAPGDKSYYHLVLLAKDHTGYQNLIQLTTRAHLEGYYYKPRVDRELLKQHSRGLVALTACLAGEVPQLILSGRHQEAREAALWYKETFPDFYFEIQRHPIPELQQVNPYLITMGQELGIPLVATNDVHYVNREDSSAHDLLLCIGTNTTVNEEKRLRMEGDFFYMKTPQEMEELFKDIPQAIENTRRIADLCNLKLEFGRLHIPEIELPPGKTPDDYLSDLCHANLPNCYQNVTDEIKQRLDYELDVIQKTQFANYFLVVWDIISFVRKRGILFGVRGSAAASIVLYYLGITSLDPLEHKLVFERFLNIERKEMPDIDMDFQDNRRDEVITYVTQKYGQDHVAQIITFGTLGARAAIRDVGRALGMSYGDVDRVARLVPYAPTMTLQRALEENIELRTIYNEDPIIKNLVDQAQRVEGISRHASTHAAGVVIAKEKLTNYVPLQLGTKVNERESVMTQFSMGDIARIGLLKMDFLGLANLTILGMAQDIIKKERGVDIDLLKIPMNDKKTFDLLSAGETTGVFQLEGAGMRRYIKELKPTTFTDIAAMVALYRPGPMEHIPTFINAKKGTEPIRYPHPALSAILEETYGVIVYQDQVLFIVREFAGYSLGQADIFRKAMGKKIPEVMKKEKHNFIMGARKKEFTNELAEQVFALIEPFAGYAFNKAHSFSYALIAYQTAYLKANYPVEYMTAFLISHSGNLEKTASAVAECRRLRIEVRRPDVNHSFTSFTIEREAGKAAICFGLAAVKNVGESAVQPVVEERQKNGEFKSIEDFCRRCDLRGVNRRVLESLIKVGAFNSLNPNRGTLLSSIERIMALAQREHKLREAGQATMFDLFGGVAPVPAPSLELQSAETTVKEKLGWEKELIGVYLSEHPFSSLAGKISNDTYLCGEITVEMDGQTVSTVGLVSTVQHLFTRDRKQFVSVTLEDLSGQVEVMVWPRVYATTASLWQEGNVVLVEGKVKLREDRVQVQCDRVSPYKADAKAQETGTTSAPKATANHVEKKEKPLAPPPPPRDMRVLLINLQQTDDNTQDTVVLRKLIALLKDYPGKDEVKLNISNGEKVTKLKLASTEYSTELHNRLAALVGEERFRVETRSA